MSRHRAAAAPAARARLGLASAVLLVAQALLVVPAATAAMPVPAMAASAAAPDVHGTGALPASVRAVISDVPTAPVRAATPDGLLPSVHYEDALRHADDVIAFEAGGRVDVGFRPRAGDTWAVGGAAPRALPAGQATGAEMARAAQGSRWTRDAQATEATEAATEAPTDAPSEPPTQAPIDAPAIDPANVEAASTTSAQTPAAAAPLEPAAAPGLFRHVFGFLPYWELSDSSTVLDYNVLSTIAYFSVGTDTNGNLLKQNSDGSTTTGWGGWTSSRLTNVINAAHSKGTRVVLTITSFAWSTSQANNQGALLGNPAARLNLARQAAAAVRDRGADGINLDFEPIASGYADEFTALVRTFRDELDAIAPGYQLTFDTTGYIGNYPLEAATAPGGADAIFIMGYDYRTAGTGTTGSIAPLSGPPYDLTDTIVAYTKRVPASKLILGIPYYGRAWSTETDLPRSKNISGTQYGASTTVIYSTAVEYAATHGRRWDAVEQSPYVVYRRENCTTTYGCVTPWRQLWYDDATSLKLKYDLVNDYGLRGAGMWALGYDDGRTELNRALADRFLHDTSPPEAGVKVLSWRQRDAGFVVSWLGSDASGVVSYDVQVSVDGGPFGAWLTGTTKTSDVWLGESGHGYAFRVRGTDLKGNVGAWDVSSTWTATPTLAVGGFASVLVDGLAMRAAPSTTGTNLGELASGQILGVVGGPVSSGGYTWWEVVGPLTAWSPVGVSSRFWAAQGSSTASYLAASRAPNSTVVDAVIRDLSVGDTGALAAVGASRTFSPNGDGRRDSLALRWSNALSLDSLALRVYRADGSLMGTIALTQTAAGAQSFTWDGRVGGATVADGTYLLALVGVGAGVTYHAPSSQPVTPAQIATFGVVVDTVGPVIASGSLDTPAFSPNGDGIRDVAGATLVAPGVAGWGALVEPLDGATALAAIRSTSGQGSTAAWAWDGRTDLGATAADGPYRLTLWASDAAGNRSARAFDVRVDTRAPVVTPGAASVSFSPNGDRAADTVALAWSTDEASAGKARIVLGTTVLKTWDAGTTGSVTWNGLDATSVAAPDGSYVFRLDVLDVAGNRTVRDARVVVDRTAGFARWSPSLFFPQDRDALSSASTVSLRLTRTAAVTLRVYRTDGLYVRGPWTNLRLGAGTHAWTWNGKTATGAFAPRGVYKVVLTAVSSLGTSTLVKWVHVDAFSVTLSSAAPAGGEALTVTLRTAETLSAAPRVAFAQPGKAAVTKTATSLGSGRYRVTFAVAPGAAGAAWITVAGRDLRGGTNQQVVALTVR